MWQDDAFEEWRSRLQDSQTPGIKRLVQSLDHRAQVSWLRRLVRDRQPVASGVAGWLSRMDTRVWTAVPGDDWELVENHEQVLLAYPQYMGSDPLAMCAMAAVWAGDDDQRWDKAGALIGPLTILGAMEGRWSKSAWANRLTSFRRAYGHYLDSWNVEASVGTDDREVSWHEVPQYAEYRQQLEFGVVPHEVGGTGIKSEIAVLLALYGTPDRDRPMMAGLVYKAMEGLWMSETWRGVM